MKRTIAIALGDKARTRMFVALGSEQCGCSNGPGSAGMSGTTRSRVTGAVSVADRRDRRRMTIVDVARGVFNEFGYAGASMSIIADRLGAQKAHSIATSRARMHCSRPMCGPNARDLKTPFSASAPMSRSINS